MVKCCVPGCNFVANNGFHNFPANEEIRLQWINLTKTQHLSEENLSRSWRKVCKNHFHSDDYTTHASGLVRLKYGAVPNLNLPGALTLQTGPDDTSNSNMPKPLLCISKPLHSENTKSTNPEEITANHAVGDNNESIIYLEPNDMKFDIVNKTMAQSAKSREGREQELMEENQKLKAIISKINKKMRYHQNQSKKRRDELKANKMNINNCIEYLSTLIKEEEMEFLKMSLKNAGKKPNAKRYSLEQKSFCLALYKQSPRAYKFMRKFITLPSKRSLGRHSARIVFEPGINTKLFDHLKANVENMADIDRYCVLIWDEMALKAHLDYSAARDIIDGFVEITDVRRPTFATHSLTFMIRGINTPYKQPVGFYYTDGLKGFELAEMIKLVMEAVLDTGLKVIGSTSDQASTNVFAIDLLMESRPKKKPLEGQLLTYKIRDAIIIHCYDPPHLLKGIRNNLLTKNLSHFVFKRWSPSTSNFRKDLDKEQALIASWDHVVDLYNFNSRGSIDFLKKITDEHIKPTKEKMKVSVAAQIFSETYGKLMLYCSKKNLLPEDSSATAQLLLFVNDLFDSLNGAGSRNDLKASVTNNSIHFKFWKHALCMLAKMNFLSKNTGEVTKRTKVFQHCASTVKGYIELTRKCLNVGMTKVSVRNMNQDGLENFFGVIRSYCQVAKAPIPIHFRSSYVTSILNNLTATNSVKSNCEPDVAIALLNNVHKFILKNKQNINHDVNGHDENNYIFDENELIICDPQCDDNSIDEQVKNEAIRYISSEICKDVLESTDCKRCENNLQTSSCDHDIISIRTDSIKYPSETFIANLKSILSVIDIELPGMCSQKCISKKLRSYIDDIKMDKMGCKDHHDEIEKKFKNCVVHYKINTFCKRVNDFLSGKITSLPPKPKYNDIEKLAYIFWKKKKRIGKFTDIFNKI